MAVAQGKGSMNHRPITRPMRALGYALVAPAILFACSSDSTAPGADAGSDASPVNDAASDSSLTPDADAATGREGGRDAAPDVAADVAADAATDVSSDAAACAPVSQACADGGAAGAAGDACIMSWASAQHPATWCAKFPNYHIVIAGPCDGFDIAVVGSVDTSTFYYYDPQSGALVGIEGRSILGNRCVAGQAPGVPLTDCYEAGVAASSVCESDGAVSD